MNFGSKYCIIASSFFIFWNSHTALAETVVICKFEKMPIMKLTFRGGMGADDNTLEIGKKEPVKLNVGSSVFSAQFGAQEFVFSLRLPSSVTVSAHSNNTLTYFGECD
jgi:hypothetical protein